MSDDQKENSRFVDPGFFEYRGCTDNQREEIFLLSQLDQSWTWMTRELSRRIWELSSQQNRNLTAAFWWLNGNPISGTLQRITPPPLEIPPVPEEERELEMYLVFIYNGIDSTCRSRELVKQRLEAIRKAKKRSVSQWEEENRSVRDELKKLKKSHFDFLISTCSLPCC